MIQQTAGVAALLYGLFADAPVGLVLYDEDLRYVLVNDALAELNGVPASAHVGRRPEEVVPELAQVLVPTLTRVLAGRPVVNLEFDGQLAAHPGPRTTLESFYPLRDSSGRVAGVGGVVVDITSRKDAQRARDEALALLDTLFQAAPVGVALWDRDLRFQRLNAALAESMSVSPEECLGRPLEDVMPELGAQAGEALRDVLERGEVIMDTEVSGDTPAAPGVRRHWSVSWYPVHDGEGAIVGAGAVWHEVTDLRHARDSERFLRELLAEERTVLHEVVARAPAGLLLLWGPDDRVRLANERLRTISQLAADPTGRPFHEALPELWRVAAPLLEQVRATGRSVAREDLVIPGEMRSDERGPRSNRYVSVTIDAVPSPADPHAGMLLVVTDTTEQVHRRRTLEQELREERAIAATLQRALLPRTLPSIPGAGLAARYEAAASERFEVGGDFYDAFAVRPPGIEEPSAAADWVVVVGDVCGKGPEAAALTAMARYTLRAEAAYAQGPGRLLELLSQQMLRNQLDSLSSPEEVTRFATVACAWVRPMADGLEVRITSAGQPDPIVLRADGSTDRVHPSGPPTGLFPESTYTDETLTLAPGEALVLYTDGVLDAGAPARQVTIDDLAAELASEPPPSADEIAAEVAEIVAANGGDEPRDDYAVLVLRATAPRA